MRDQMSSLPWTYTEFTGFDARIKCSVNLTLKRMNTLYGERTCTVESILFSQLYTKPTLTLTLVASRPTIPPILNFQIAGSNDPESRCLAFLSRFGCY